MAAFFYGFPGRISVLIRSMMMSLAIVILAAGKGTRMRSPLPKVLHHLGGKPLLQHVVDTARAFEPEQIVIVAGHGAERVQQEISGADLAWAIQQEQRGTAHAVSQALPLITAEKILVLYGDVPLTTEKTLGEVISGISDDKMAVLTFTTEDPTGYGRIIRDEGGDIARIIEQKDASPADQAVKECNSGIIGISQKALDLLLEKVGNDNAQGEYYLTDVIALFREHIGSVAPVETADITEVLGVNNKSQLSDLERSYQHRQAEILLDKGMMLADKNRFDVRGEVVNVGEDSFVDINCLFEGKVSLGSHVEIGPNCCLRDCSIGDNVTILANSVIEDAVIGADSSIGPFARIRPGTVLGTKTKVGNFVETKNAKVAAGSKINHLSYVGDAELGEHVNVGAGTITCNYDGANKHKTVIRDHVFVGSNSALVAPVEIGEGATIAAGSTITREVRDNQLAIARSRQSAIEAWKRPKKGK